MTRSAGRWSPFAALTTSPTATWYYQPRTSRGRERGSVAVVRTGQSGEERIGWEKKEGWRGWKRKHRQTDKQQTHKGERDNCFSFREMSRAQWSVLCDQRRVWLFICSPFHKTIQKNRHWRVDDRIITSEVLGFTWKIYPYIYCANRRENHTFQSVFLEKCE